MNCKEYEHLFTKSLNKELRTEEEASLEKHLHNCIDCEAELTELQHIFQLIAEMPKPEPSDNLKVNFDKMLKEYDWKVRKKRPFWRIDFIRWKSFWEAQPRWPMVYNLALLAVFFGVCYGYFSYQNRSQDNQLQQLTKQVDDIKQSMTLAMLDNPSASQRMKAVSYTTEMSNADQQLILALLSTLNNDPNVNVRLVTLDALMRFAGYPEVREGLILSINSQDSPLMQSAIADVMVKLQEKRAIKSFKKLLKQQELDNGVRMKINETINSLI